MRTVRFGVFETNSSSCHVLTIADEKEMEMLKRGEMFVYVPEYSSDDDDGPYDSQIVGKEKILELIDGKLSEEDYKKYFDLICSLLDQAIANNDFTVFEENEELPDEVRWSIEDVYCKFRHDESIDDIFSGCKEKEINGTKLYVSCWSKYC